MEFFRYNDKVCFLVPLIETAKSPQQLYKKFQKNFLWLQ